MTSEGITLVITSFIAAVVYVLRLLDADAVANTAKWELVRRGIIGSIGSIISVNISFYSLLHYGFPFNLSIAIASGIGFLGADSLSKLAEKLLTQLIDKFTK